MKFSLSIFILFALAYHLLFQNPGVEGTDLLDATCRKTQYRDLCLKTLRSDPRSANSDVKGLDKIIIAAGLNYAKATLSQLQDTIKNTKSKELVGILKTCEGNYEKLITSDLPSSARELTNEQLVQAHDFLVSASDDVTSCSDGFSGSTLVGSQFENRNIYLEQLTIVAVEILETLG